MKLFSAPAPASSSASAAADPQRRLVSRALWFAVPAIVGLVALVLLVALRQGMLSNKDQINFLAASATGITPGMPVKLNGFVVGAVSQIVLLPPATESQLRVRVELNIYRDYMGYIPRTTVIRLAQESWIGQGVIELLPQRYDARPVARGEVLPFERSASLGEIADSLQQQLTPVLHDAHALSASLGDPQGDFQQSLKASRLLLQALPESNAQLQRTLQQGGAAVGRLEQRLAGSLDGVDQGVASINRSLPGMLDKLDQSAGHLQQAGAQLRQVASGTAEAMPAILDDAGRIVHGGRQVVDGAMQSWPVTLLLPTSSAPPAVPLDSQQGLPPPRLVQP